jgi:FMN phosphatase YigB (HAD superfamily)
MPDVRIFQLALARASVLPGSALFVGDSLSTDVLGANRAGLYSVLACFDDEDAVIGKYPRDGRPRAIVRESKALLPLVEALHGA